MEDIKEQLTSSMVEWTILPSHRGHLAHMDGRTVEMILGWTEVRNHPMDCVIAVAISASRNSQLEMNDICLDW